MSPEEEKVQRLEQRIAQLEQALQEKNAPASSQPSVPPPMPHQEAPPTIPPPAPEIPPMLELAKELNCEKQIVLGYRDELFLLDEFRKQGEVYIATEDGSVGTEGNVLDAIRENGLTADVIYACGPLPMLRALKEYAAKEGIECWISMEERMACGIGACLACVCKSTEKDAHSNVKSKRVCKEGPVFRAEEVDF